MVEIGAQSEATPLYGALGFDPLLFSPLRGDRWLKGTVDTVSSVCRVGKYIINVSANSGLREAGRRTIPALRTGKQSVRVIGRERFYFPAQDSKRFSSCVRRYGCNMYFHSRIRSFIDESNSAVANEKFPSSERNPCSLRILCSAIDSFQETIVCAIKCSRHRYPCPRTRAFRARNGASEATRWNIKASIREYTFQINSPMYAQGYISNVPLVSYAIAENGWNDDINYRLRVYRFVETVSSVYCGDQTPRS